MLTKLPVGQGVSTVYLINEIKVLKRQLDRVYYGA